LEDSDGPVVGVAFAVAEVEAGSRELVTVGSGSAVQSGCGAVVAVGGCVITGGGVGQAVMVSAASGCGAREATDDISSEGSSGWLVQAATSTTVSSTVAKASSLRLPGMVLIMAYLSVSHVQ
jgi:hypothetical protein